MKLIPIPMQYQRPGSRAETSVAQRPELAAVPAIDFDGGLGAPLIELFQEQSRYHRKTMNRRGRMIKRYLQEPALITKAAKLRTPAMGQRVLALPEPTPCGVTLTDALAARRSGNRAAMAAPITLQQLSDLLHMAARVNLRHGNPAAPGVTFGLRPYPSPGALYPCELYVWTARVEGLDGLVYRYDPAAHALVDVASAAGGNFSTVEAGSDKEPPACALTITCVPARVTDKYGVRGFRFALLEAGHLGQNLSLAAQALALRSLVYGSYYDAELERALGIDGCDEMIASVLLIGGH